jgi:hypothetical protein
MQSKALVRGLAPFLWSLSLGVARPVPADQTVAVDGSAAGELLEPSWLARISETISAPFHRPAFSRQRLIL